MIAERRASRPAIAATCCRCCSLAQDEEDDGARDDRSAGPRRGDDDLPRRPRDDGERADVDLVPARAARPTSKRGCTTRSIACSAAGCRRWPIIPSLPYVEQVVTESMRLYPPAWIIGRRAIERLSRSATTSAPARSIVVMSPYVMQRDARFFAEPERFDPDRWTPEFKASLPPFAYFPFGGGPRRCIGESFAWMELILRRGDDRAAVAAAPRAGPSGGAAAGRHAAHEARDADDRAGALSSSSGLIFELRLQTRAFSR